MQELKLPVITDPFPESKKLSMDEYEQFVLHHLKYTFDKKEYHKQKIKQNVSVPFRLSNQ
jgi:hypothetical protein